MQELATAFASRGWVAFSVNYRKHPDCGLLPAKWPAERCVADAPKIKAWWRAMQPHRWKANKMYPAARDAKAAVRWAHANAARFGVDAERIVAVGWSAGGFLSCMLGLSEEGDYRDEVRRSSQHF